MNLKIVPDTWPNITAITAKPETTPDMWIHWVTTYFVDPENWIGPMYDSQSPRHVEGLVLVQERERR